MREGVKGMIFILNPNPNPNPTSLSFYENWSFNKDALFSHSRLKHSITSSLLLWAGIMPDVHTFFVKRLSNLYMSTTRS